MLATPNDDVIGLSAYIQTSVLLRTVQMACFSLVEDAILS